MCISDRREGLKRTEPDPSHSTHWQDKRQWTQSKTNEILSKCKKKTYYCQSSQTLEQTVLRGWGVSILGAIQNLTGHSAWATCSRWPFSEQRVGLYDLQNSLPLPVVLWVWILHWSLYSSFVLCLDSTQVASIAKKYLSSKASGFQELFPRNYSIWKSSHNFLSPGMLLMSLSQTGAQAQWTAWGTEQKQCLFKDRKAWISFLWHLVHLSQNRTWKKEIICSKRYVLVIWIKVMEQFRQREKNTMKEVLFNYNTCVSPSSSPPKKKLHPLFF